MNGIPLPTPVNPAIDGTLPRRTALFLTGGRKLTIPNGTGIASLTGRKDRVLVVLITLTGAQRGECI
jgi:hypothetical protein